LAPAGDQITSIPCREESDIREPPTIQRTADELQLPRFGPSGDLHPGRESSIPLLGNGDYSHVFERFFFGLIPLAVITVIGWKRHMATRILVRPDTEILEG
jgi:hypothetical protein